MDNKVTVKEIDWCFIYNQLSARERYFHMDLIKHSSYAVRTKECLEAIDKIQLAMEFARQNI